MEMPGGNNYSKLADALKAGRVEMATIDQAVRRILVQMEKFGLLNRMLGPNPSNGLGLSTAEIRQSRAGIDAAEQARNASIARELAEEGAVLLKNDGNALPLKSVDMNSLVVIGPTAKVLLIGGGGSAKGPAVPHGQSVRR